MPKPARDPTRLAHLNERVDEIVQTTWHLPPPEYGDSALGQELIRAEQEVQRLLRVCDELYPEALAAGDEDALQPIRNHYCAIRDFVLRAGTPDLAGAAAKLRLIIDPEIGLPTSMPRDIDLKALQQVLLIVDRRVRAEPSEEIIAREGPNDAAVAAGGCRS